MLLSLVATAISPVQCLNGHKTVVYVIQRCCRQRRTSSRLEGSTVPAVDGESASDDDDVNGPNSNASVHLYVPVDRDSISSAGDDTWQNVTVEPPHHSSQAEGASYVQLQCVPHSRPWYVFTDSSDNSDVDDPLIDCRHVFVPTQSTSSANSTEMSSNNLLAASGDHYSHLEGVESGAKL